MMDREDARGLGVDVNAQVAEQAEALGAVQEVRGHQKSWEQNLFEEDMGCGAEAGGLGGLAEAAALAGEAVAQLENTMVRGRARERSRSPPGREDRSRSRSRSSGEEEVSDVAKTMRLGGSRGSEDPAVGGMEI